MTEWWNGLTQTNQVFYGVAVFFSVFFVWQLISALMGLDADHADVDMDGSPDIDMDGAATHGEHMDAGGTVAAFKLLSIRSIITFFTLFSWGCAMYLDNGYPATQATAYSALWGLAGMISVAAVFYVMPKLTHTGTADLGSCVGTTGTVYLDIPEQGSGEVRVMVSGTLSHIKARTADGKALKAGVEVRVASRLDHATVVVEPV